MENKHEDRNTWAIGGGVLLGMGIGMAFLEISVLIFIGSTFAGLGVGLIISAIISGK